MTCSPSTSSSALPFSKLAGCFTTTPSSPPHIILALSSDLFVVIGLLCLSMPLAVPSNLITPSETKTALRSGPLVDFGSDTTLNEGDVWNLSPTMQSRPIFVKFSTIPQSILLRRLWTANLLDLIIQLCRPLLQTNPRYHRFGVPYLELQKARLERTSTASWHLPARCSRPRPMCSTSGMYDASKRIRSEHGDDI
ncbi:hypothetical protein K443DRAFT_489956 [Laccaria amethystina LaAM-08-1]|uniref:Uncharacterized protein n=1 Tax=Laccaria amethystina LaAM-08-1 TaxID=1095629 RepID=A0A0C9WMS6_9AGAR|nr:hypothetical protein K443DRAFT_489956 [Laccaria amethystina LaAM-08-1]